VKRTSFFSCHSIVVEEIETLNPFAAFDHHIVDVINGIEHRLKSLQINQLKLQLTEGFYDDLCMNFEAVEYQLICEN
jgi:hypothetical protein